MPLYVICHTCRNKIYLQTNERSELPTSFNIRCDICYNTNTYYPYQVLEERYDFSCTVCNRRFFIRKFLPLRVACPHCDSILFISSDGSLSEIRRGERVPPPPGSTSVTGAVGGALLGGLLAGPIGAFFGLLLGGSVGVSVEVLEATEV